MKAVVLSLLLSVPAFSSVTEVNCELKEKTSELAPINYMKIRKEHDSALGERITTFHFKLPPGFYDHTDFTKLLFHPSLNRAVSISGDGVARLELDNYRELHGILRVGDNKDGELAKRKTYLYGNCR